jgi:hypothetical protein
MEEKAVIFRFDHDTHTYTVDGQEVPHITGLLEASGLTDTRWFRDEHSDRGRAVHRLTADYDLGALTITETQPDTPYRGYLLAYRKAIQVMHPVFDAIEEPSVHPGFRFGGRPDRRGQMYGLQGILEIKTGVPDPSHDIQTALQAILVEPIVKVPADAQIRVCLYLQRTGTFKLIEHRRRYDFDHAMRIIKQCCK